MAVTTNIIPVSVESRFIGVSDHTHVMAGNVAIDYVQITLDDEWSGLKSFVTFTGCAPESTTVDYTTDAIEIPWEQITDAGDLYIGIQGFEATADVTVDTEGQLVTNGTAATLNAAAMTVSIQVFESSESGGTSPSQPTQGTLVRVEQDILKLEELTEGADKTIARINTACDGAEAATVTANTAATNADEKAAACETATTAATAATTAAESATTAAKSATESANTAATKADTSASNADTATAAANTATEKATAATTAAESATTTATESAAKADTAAAGASTAADAANTAAESANTAATTADTAATNADTATAAANTAADKANAAAEAVSMATIGLSPAQLSAMVKLGTAPIVLPVGTQLFTKLNGNGYVVDEFAWDVVHHFDGSDDDHPLVTLEDGSQVKGMMLQAHRTVPWSIVWEPKQAALVVTGDMPAGTYHFTVKVTVAWAKGIAGEVGEKAYQFTTTTALSAGAQLVYSGGETTDPTTASLTVYASATSTTAIETCAMSLGSDGTDLGTMADATPSVNATDYVLLNNIQRMIYGSNRWSTSQEREALNSTTIAQGGTVFSRPWCLVGKSGLPACLPADFVKVLGKVERKQELHPWDGGQVETTYDMFFPVSVREHGINSYLSATADGYKSEGVPLDYWTKLRTASGRTAWVGWNTYPELITYDSVATTTARYVWLRSARRYAYGACGVGCVCASGAVDVAYAYGGFFAAPACVII